MSRTTLRYLNGPRRDDGTHWQTRVVRDDRVSGLREHRRDRRAAKTALTSGSGDDLPNGTRHRYRDRYGEYELELGYRHPVIK